MIFSELLNRNDKLRKLTFGTNMLKWKVLKSSIVYFTEAYTNKTKFFFSKKKSPKSVTEKGVGVCEARFGIYHISFFPLQRCQSYFRGILNKESISPLLYILFFSKHFEERHEKL